MVEKLLEWLVLAVANCLEQYIVLCSPRPLYEIEIKRKRIIIKQHLATYKAKFKKII